MIEIKGIWHERVEDAPFIGALISAVDCKYNCKECFNQHIKDIESLKYNNANEIINEVKSNFFNEGVILAGLEWTLQQEECLELIKCALNNNLKVILYTGMEETDFAKQCSDIYNLPIYIKFGRYVEQFKCENNIQCGVKLASSNQYVLDNTNEVWKDIEGYEGYYQVSSLGRVRSLDRYVLNGNGLNNLCEGKENKLFIDKDGYRYVSLSKYGISKKFKVHRLVAKEFITNDNHKPQVNHINEIKSDNRVVNLEWNTVKENLEWGTRTIRMAEKKSKKVIQYSLDGKFLNIFKSVSEASRILNVKTSAICNCCNNKGKIAYNSIWKYFDDVNEENIFKDIQFDKKNVEYYRNQNSKIYQYSLEGKLVAVFDNAYEIKNKLGYDNSAICKCCNGKQKSAYGYIWSRGCFDNSVEHGWC